MNKGNKILANIMTGTIIITSVPIVNTFANNSEGIVKLQPKSDSEIVSIPDENLKQEILKTLKKDEGYNLTKEDLESIEELKINSKDIENLEGIQFATNLKKLDLSFNSKLDDISKLSNLKSLEELNISHIPIETIDPLTGLTNLKSLYITGNSKLKNIEPVKNLVNLENLKFWWYMLNDDFDGDVSHINGLPNLKYLRVGSGYSNNILNHETIVNLPKLEELDMGSYYGLEDISFVSNFKTLKILDLSYTDVASLEPLKSLTELEKILANDCELKSLEGVENLTKLMHADFSSNYRKNNDFLDISPLANAKELKDLDLSFSEVKDISVLSNLTKLTDLNLYQNEIEDISSLKDLNELKDLSIGYNKVSSLEPLRGKESLKYLQVHSNNIYDASPLNGLNLSSPSLYSQDVVIESRIENGKAIIKNPFKNVDGTSINDIVLNESETAKLSINNNNEIVIDNIPSGTLVIGAKFNANEGNYRTIDGDIIFDFSDGKDFIIDYTQDKVEWTNDSVLVSVVANAKDSVIKKIKLPNGEYVDGNTTSYRISSNGTYKFIAETDDGQMIEKDITISNIDRDMPVLEVTENKSVDGEERVFNIIAKDYEGGSGIKKIVLPDGSEIKNEDGSELIRAEYVTKSKDEFGFKAYDNVGNYRTLTIPKLEEKENTPPIITAKNKEIYVGDEFDPMKDVSAYDEEDGDLTKRIKVTKNTVKPDVVGSYEITYEVEDSKGLKTERSITVDVKRKGTTIFFPTIKMEDLVLYVGDKYNPLEGVTATDGKGNDITHKIEVIRDIVDTSKPGRYYTTYKVYDDDRNGTESNRIVEVIERENTLPIINAQDQSILLGSKFDPMKDVVASDKEDGDLTDKIEIIENNVNPNKVGEYSVTYSVTDNSDSTVIKKIIVKVFEEDEVPVIIAKDITIYKNSEFNPLTGVSAIDKVDGDITWKIKILQNNVDISKVGEYNVVYSVENSKGALVTKTINVSVIEKNNVNNNTNSNGNSNTNNNSTGGTNNSQSSSNTSNTNKPQTGDNLFIHGLGITTSLIGLGAINKKQKREDD